MTESEDWYVVGTVRDGARIDDDDNDACEPLAVLGPWTRPVAQQKCARLRAKFPKRHFDIRPETEIEFDRENCRVRVSLP